MPPCVPPPGPPKTSVRCRRRSNAIRTLSCWEDSTMRLALPLVLVLAACGQTQFFAPLPSVSELRLNVRPDTVMINEASIPEYAINQEIPIQQPDGSLLADTDKLWADLPDRALAG